MLVYLTAQTWAEEGSEVNSALASDIERALEAGVELLLLHEAPSFLEPRAGDDEAGGGEAYQLQWPIHQSETRAPIEFSTLMRRTPPELVAAGIYSQAEVDAMTFRVGLNNAFDKQPPTYAPNVQSGTDPSLYDVIGRRAYVSARLRF